MKMDTLYRATYQVNVACYEEHFLIRMDEFAQLPHEQRPRQGHMIADLWATIAALEDEQEMVHGELE